jgi:hypothetical protein
LGDDHDRRLLHARQGLVQSERSLRLLKSAMLSIKIAGQNYMQKRKILIFLAFISISCLAETKKDLAALQKEMTVLARESHIETVKKYCVNFWIEPSKRDVLSKFASVAEMCECVQSDMKFTVSDDLAERLFNIQLGHHAGSPNKYLNEEESLKTTKEWFDRYSAADISCKERFLRRR